MFGLSKPTYLGIDFGTSSIKAVEVSVKNGKAHLVNYGQVSLAKLGNKGAPEGHSYDDELVLYLRALLKKLSPKTKSAMVSMPAFIGLISLIDFPEMAENELEEAVQYEAKRYIPSALEDIALSWEVVGIRPDAEGKPRQEILVVAALKKEVERYRGYVENANFKMEFLELETFSMVRAMAWQKEGLVMLIDIGSRATNLILVESGVVRVSRNLDAGGNDVTRTLMESLSISMERAEALKKSGQDFLNDPASAIVFPSIDMIAGEAYRMVETYKKKYPELDCQEVILSGGTASFTGLVQYYQKQFGVTVAKGDPWSHIEYPESQKADIEALGTSFSVALGLILSAVDGQNPKVMKSGKEGFSLKGLLNKKL